MPLTTVDHLANGMVSLEPEKGGKERLDGALEALDSTSLSRMARMLELTSVGSLFEVVECWVGEWTDVGGRLPVVVGGSG